MTWYDVEIMTCPECDNEVSVSKVPSHTVPARKRKQVMRHIRAIHPNFDGPQIDRIICSMLGNDFRAPTVFLSTMPPQWPESFTAVGEEEIEQD